MDVSIPSSPLPCDCIRTFLDETKNDFLNSQIDFFDSVLVFGNESTDLDSIISAILIARYLRQVHSIQAFPVLNTFRPQTLRLRGEVSCAIGPNSHELMISLEDVIVKTSNCPSIKVFLVDHNDFSVQWPESLVTKIQVYGIIDHHVDGGKFTETCYMGRIIVECGSNAALIIQEIFKNPNYHLMDFEFLKFALFPIIYDTKNLTYRDTSIDKSAVQLLLQSHDHMVSTLSADGIWSALLASEVDELGSSLSDLLYKDFKKFHLKCSTYCLGMSTLRASLEDHITRNHYTFPQVIDQILIPFFSYEKLDGLILIFSNQKSQEFLFLLPNQDIDHLIKYFNAAGMQFTQPKYEVLSVPMPSHRSDTISYARAVYIPQLNYQFNRKQTYPLFDKFLSSQSKN